MEQLETLKSQEKTITRNAQVVEQMYALLGQYDVKAPSEDMVQVDDLRTIKVFTWIQRTRPRPAWPLRASLGKSVTLCNTVFM